MTSVNDYEVVVTCDDESTRSSAHRGRSVQIVHYYWDPEDETWGARGHRSDMTREAGVAYLRARPEARWDRETGFGMPGRVARALIAGAGLERGVHEKEHNEQKSCDLQCPFCELHVVRHLDKVWPVLDLLRSSGLHQVSLRQLQERIGAT